MKFLRSTLFSFLFLAILALPSYALQLSADKAILMDAASGDVLFAKEPDVPAPPASTTKLMTALLAMDFGEDLHASFEV